MKEISIKDFEGLKIGNAENVQAGTGCTVLLFGENRSEGTRLNSSH